LGDFGVVTLSLFTFFAWNKLGVPFSLTLGPRTSSSSPKKGSRGGSQKIAGGGGGGSLGSIHTWWRVGMAWVRVVSRKGCEKGREMPYK